MAEFNSFWDYKKPSGDWRRRQKSINMQGITIARCSRKDCKWKWEGPAGLAEMQLLAHERLTGDRLHIPVWEWKHG